MTSIQILVAILTILATVKTLISFRKNKITLPVFLFWLVLWLAILIIAVVPQVTRFLENRLLGIGRGVDAAIYFSIIFIFFIIFKIFAKLEKIEQEITEIIRHFALKDFKKDEDSSN